MLQFYLFVCILQITGYAEKHNAKTLRFAFKDIPLRVAYHNTALCSLYQCEENYNNSISSIDD